MTVLARLRIRPFGSGVVSSVSFGLNSSANLVFVTVALAILPRDEGAYLALSLPLFYFVMGVSRAALAEGSLLGITPSVRRRWIILSGPSAALAMVIIADIVGGGSAVDGSFKWILLFSFGVAAVAEVARYEITAQRPNVIADLAWLVGTSVGSLLAVGGVGGDLVVLLGWTAGALCSASINIWLLGQEPGRMGGASREADGDSHRQPPEATAARPGGWSGGPAALRTALVTIVALTLGSELVAWSAFGRSASDSTIVGTKFLMNLMVPAGALAQMFAFRDLASAAQDRHGTVRSYSWRETGSVGALGLAGLLLGAVVASGVEGGYSVAIGLAALVVVTVARISVVVVSTRLRIQARIGGLVRARVLSLVAVVGCAEVLHPSQSLSFFAVLLVGDVAALAYMRAISRQPSGQSCDQRTGNTAGSV